MSEEVVISTGACVFFMMIMFYMTCGALVEKYHLHFGHEASFTVLMGKYCYQYFIFIFHYLQVCSYHGLNFMEEIRILSICYNSMIVPSSSFVYPQLCLHQVSTCIEVTSLATFHKLCFLVSWVLLWHFSVFPQ